MGATITVDGKASFVRGGTQKNGEPYLSFQLGVYDGKDVNTGKSKYINLSVFVNGKSVDILAPKLTDGVYVIANGELSQKEYQGKQNLEVKYARVRVIEPTTKTTTTEDISF